MIIPEHVKQAVNTALKQLPEAMASKEALVMLYAIGLQESRFQHRFQIVQGKPGAKGPARGYWQFERGGGCAGVIRHSASRYWMDMMCRKRGVPVTQSDLWRAIEQDDVLAASAARLLLFTDPKRLPALGDKDAAWDLYIRVWRPGKPHRQSWDVCYAAAMKEVR